MRMRSQPPCGELTKEVTRLRMRPGSPPPVQEAAAALHDLVARSSAADGPDGVAAGLAELGSCNRDWPRRSRPS
jgi:hypothetical protein